MVVPATLRAALGTLHTGLGGAVALISGRAISDLDALFAPLRLRASGVHGAETRFDPEADISISSQYILSGDVVAELRRIAALYPGTLVEDKRFSVAVHFRAVPEAGAALRGDIEAFLATPAGHGCRVLPGHMVFEVKRTGFDKGTAIGSFLERVPFKGRRPIFVGDDITDLPGFERVLARGGLAYSVTTQRPGLSGHFADPDAVRAWLSAAAAGVK